MQQLESKIVQNMYQLNISSNPTNILTYYYNFHNIHDTLLYFLGQHNTNQSISQNCPRSEELSSLKFTYSGKFQTARFGCLILRLLYIDTPAEMMQLVMSLKNKKNEVFNLYQALARLLIESDQYHTQDIVSMLNKIKQKVKQTSAFSERSLSLTYNYHNDRKSCIAIFTIPNKHISFKNFQRTIQDFIQYPSIFSKLIIEISQHFSFLGDTKQLVNYILLTYGSICHFQTIQNPQIIRTQKKPLLPIYSRESITVLSHFSILIQESDSQIPGSQSVKMTIEYSERSLKKMTTGKFYNLQKKLFPQYFKQFGSNYAVLINDRVYCLDEKHILGAGGFGTTLQARSLQICSAKSHLQGHRQKITLHYRLNNIAIKTLKENTKAYEEKGYKVSQKREQLIHTLFGQLRFHQSQKRAKKFLGIQTNRQLIGFSSLVAMEEIFKIKQSQNEYSHDRKTFMVFQQGKGSLHQKKINQGIKKSDNCRAIQLWIFKQLFQGIYCLHYDINNQYSHLLEKYMELKVKLEDYRENYTNKKQIITQDQRCGIYHRDIKPGNIVLFYQDKLENITDCSQIRVGLIDFGMAGITNFETNKTKTSCGSKYYMAPEVRNSQGYTQRVDIWSAGIIFYECFTWSKLFQLQSHNDQGLVSLQYAQKNLEKFKSAYEREQPIIVQMVLGCVKNDKNTRLSAQGLLELVHLNSFNIPIPKRDQFLYRLLNDHKINTVSAKILYLWGKEPKEIIVSDDVAQNQLKYSKFLYEFNVKQLLETQAINIEWKVSLLLAAIAAFIKQRRNTKLGIDAILQAHIVNCVSEAGQQDIFITFGKNTTLQHSIQPQNNDHTYKLSSSITLVQNYANTKGVADSFKLILSQRQRSKLNLQKNKQSASQKYFQGYNIKLNNQKQSVIVSKSIFIQRNQQYEQVIIGDLFLNNNNFNQIIHKNGSCTLLWYQPNHNSQLQHNIQNIIQSMLKVLKYFQSQQQKIIIQQKYCHNYYQNNQDFSLNSTIEKFAKIQRKNQEVTILLDSTVLFRQSSICYKKCIKYPTICFIYQFKNYLHQIIQQLKQVDKVQYKYAFHLSLLNYANDSQHYQKLAKLLEDFSQNAAYFVAKMNMLANNFFQKASISNMKSTNDPKASQLNVNLVRKLSKTFMEDLQAMGNCIFKQMQKKFVLKGSWLQQQYYHNKIYFGKFNIHKFYLTLRNIYELYKLHSEQLKQIQQVLDNYKDLFVFIDVFSQFLGYNPNKQRLNISFLTEGQPSKKDNSISDQQNSLIK